VVHGVSDQQPFDSARSIANLLFHRFNPQARYTTFVEQQIRIPVQALIPPGSQPLQSKDQASWRDSLDERGDRIRIALNAINRDTDNKSSANQEVEHNLDPEKHRQVTINPQNKKDVGDRIDQYAHEFIYDFLAHYNPQEAPDLSANFYDTIRLETQREGSNGAKQTVHLYELYWADLSRLGTGFFQFFSAFYQLLFHLASLGRHTLDLATLEYASYAKGWRHYSDLHAWAGRMLAIPIPLLSLYLLIAGFLSLPSNIPVSLQPWIAVSVFSLLCVAVISYWLWKNVRQSLLARMALPPIGLIPIVALAIVQFRGLLGQFEYLQCFKLLTIEWLFVSTALVWFLLIKPYATRRRGVDRIAAWSGGGLFLLAVWLICSAENQSIEAVVDASFRMIEIIYTLLVIALSIFYALYVFVLGWSFCVQWLLSQALDKQNVTGETRTAAKERARRANWTARVSLWAPAVLFTSVTTTLWAGVVFAGSSLLPEGYSYRPSTLFKKIFLSDRPETEFPGPVFMTQLLADPLSIVILGSLLVALILVAWSLLPSLWAEIQPPADRTPQAGDPRLSSQSENRPIDSQEQQWVQRFGVWLTRGGELIYIALNWLPILLAMAIFIILSYYLADYIRILLNLNSELPGWIEQPFQWIAGVIQWMKRFSAEIVGVLSLLLTASATSILVLGRRLDQLSLGFRSILDVILDVDNYLRLHPRQDNPRARIYARYSSLLRYLCHGPAPTPAKVQFATSPHPLTAAVDHQGYDALLIVAHSQGTVITADLLRFLTKEAQTGQQLLSTPSSLADPMPIAFFSMGSPINQLYGAGFPHLYNWALNFNGAANGLGQNPKPSELGLVRWVNTFRSGDYVGRALWRSIPSSDMPLEQQLKRLFKADDDDSEQLKLTQKHHWREFCLGAGGHTHYWDATADGVAEEIDRLIDEIT
jgi:hypothetical protein